MCLRLILCPQRQNRPCPPSYSLYLAHDILDSNGHGSMSTSDGLIGSGWSVRLLLRIDPSCTEAGLIDLRSDNTGKQLFLVFCFCIVQTPSLTVTVAESVHTGRLDDLIVHISATQGRMSNHCSYDRRGHIAGDDVELSCIYQL